MGLFSEIDYEQYDAIIQIDAKYFFKKAIYQPAEYAGLKSCIDSIVKKFNEQIVLIKI